MKQYEVSEETLQKVLDYLASKPYLEVHKLVQLIQLAKPIQEQPKSE